MITRFFDFFVGHEDIMRDGITRKRVTYGLNMLTTNF